MPRDVADAHGVHYGLPVPIEPVGREELHQGALRPPLHEHRVRDMLSRHTQHNLTRVPYQSVICEART